MCLQIDFSHSSTAKGTGGWNVVTAVALEGYRNGPQHDPDSGQRRTTAVYQSRVLTASGGRRCSVGPHGKCTWEQSEGAEAGEAGFVVTRGWDGSHGRVRWAHLNKSRGWQGTEACHSGRSRTSAWSP